MLVSNQSLTHSLDSGWWLSRVPIPRIDYFDYLFNNGRGVRPDQIDWSVSDPALTALLANLIATTVPPTITGISISNITETSATAIVDVFDPDGSPVHLRFKATIDADFGPAVQMPTIEAVMFDLTGLTAGLTYQVRASLKADFSASLSARFDTEMAAPTPPSRWTLVTLDDAPPPSAADVLANGTESALDREILVTNPGHNGYFWVYSSTPIDYFGPAETGNNQFGLLVTRPDVVLNGTTYHVWRLFDIQAAFAFDFTWYAYES